jgi:hypothetical protein
MPSRRPDLDALLAEIVESATVTSSADAAGLLREYRPPSTDSLLSVRNLVLQLPLQAAMRERFLAELADVGPMDDGDERLVAVAAHALRTRAPRIPTASPSPLLLPGLGDALDDAVATVLDLDVAVPAPWTIIGGLMVLAHCVEHGVRFPRTTVDADVSVGVFTHRDSLRVLTGRLLDAGFVDATPDPTTGGPRLSYRWVRGSTQVDITVPPRANRQRRTPTAAGGRPAVEMDGTQQALRRTERIAARLADGRSGHLRRPDLMGAVVLKSVAVNADRRRPRRHREDLVVLADLMAASGLHQQYASSVRPKDARRIAAAVGEILLHEWQLADDPEAARAALDHLAATSSRSPATSPPPTATRR